MRKIKKYKVGMDSETYAISLVESPAIEETLVALEEEKEIKVQMTNEEKHMVYSAVLVPDKPIYRRNEDGDEFYVEFTKESIEHMSQQFLKEYKQNEVTLDHETMASDITVVESWLKSDLYKDKSVALGLNENLPIGTWFAGMKVNQIDVWDRVKSGELRGFSVESLLRLEDFSKQNNNDMIETNEMFWDKLKNILSDVFTSLSMSKEKDEVELEHQEPVAEPTVETTVEEPKAEEPTVTVEPTEEPKLVEEVKPVEEPKAEEPKQDANEQLQELIKSLKEEINALKESNSGLQEKVKELGKQPSAKPISTVGGNGGNGGDAYARWREQMRGML